MPNKNKDDMLISLREIRETIKRSGYLLEQRVEPIIGQGFGYVETNPIFKDPDTGKSREIDISALSASRLYNDDMSFIFPMLLCECENNSQPTVFFTGESVIPYLRRDDLKLSGLPIKFWNNRAKEYMGFADFTGMENFHHYCMGKIATQYCSFQLKKDKSCWIALHSDEQHDTFDKLIKVVDYEVNKHFESWYLSDKAEEPVNIQIYYPLVILQSGLYTAHLNNNRLILKKTNHVQFRQQFFSSQDKMETYQIDIIVESYLPSYLETIAIETEKMKQVFQRKKKMVFKSIQQIIEETKKEEGSPKSYRKYFDF
ncbi:MAG: hypothetical protein HY530_04740 [Chloroflexi bacterium]|nr:hypothetical protein [Chloroflexota bacterium]